MAERGQEAKGVWTYLFPAVGKEGKTTGFLLTAKRDKAAAMGFLTKPCSLSLRANE